MTESPDELLDHLSDTKKRIEQPPYDPDVIMPVFFVRHCATENAQSTKELLDKVNISNAKVEETRKGLSDAYPRTFSKKLKARARYYPFEKGFEFSNKMIRNEIVGDFALDLKDEMTFARSLKLKDGETILDVGGGYGRTALLLADEADVNITIVEKDESKIPLIKGVLKKYRLKNGKVAAERIIAIEADAKNLRETFKDRSVNRFDTIIIKDLLGLLAQADMKEGLSSKDMAEALREEIRTIIPEIAGLLKEDGRIVIWDADCTGTLMKDTLVLGMYLQQCKEINTTSNIGIGIGGNKNTDKFPEQRFKALYGIFRYAPEDEELAQIVEFERDRRTGRLSHYQRTFGK